MAFQTASRLQQANNRAAVCSGASSRGVVAPRTLHGAPRRGSSMITRVMEITSEAQFEQEVLKAQGPVLVDFWAPWCGPCKLVAPLMTWAEKEHEALKVVKVEHDANKGLIEKYKVYGLPALIVFKDGKMVEGSKNEGAIGKANLQKYIQKHVLSTVNA